MLRWFNGRLALLLLPNHAAERVLCKRAVERIARTLRPLRLYFLDRRSTAKSFKRVLQVARRADVLTLAVRGLVLLYRDILVVLDQHILQVV